MSPILIGIAAFVGVAALVFGVSTLLSGEDKSALEDRLDVLTGAGAGSARPTGRKEPTLLAQLEGQPNFVERLLSRYGSIKPFFEQADSPLSPTQVLVAAGVLAGVGVLGSLVSGAPLALAPLAALLGLAPFVWLYFRRRRRLSTFGKQLPEALELISRALRAGHSLAAGFSLVADEMADPIAREFGRCYEQQNLGLPLEEALDEMTVRVPNLDLRFFATAVILQRQTGGDLAEILDKIGHLVRERFKIWGQIQALTGEGRLSGIVLLGLPPVLFVVMYRLNPDYCKVLFTDPMGQQMLIGATISQVIGALVIRKIVNIKV